MSCLPPPDDSLSLVMREHRAISVFPKCPHHRWAHPGIRAVPPDKARAVYEGCAIFLSHITCTDTNELMPQGIPLKDMGLWRHAIFTCASLRGGLIVVWYKEYTQGGDTREINPLCQHMKLSQFHAGGPVRGEVVLLVVPSSLCNPPLAKDSQIFFATDLCLLAHYCQIHAPLPADYFRAAQSFCAPPAQLITSPPYVDPFSAAERRAPRRALRHGVDRAVHGA